MLVSLFALCGDFNYVFTQITQFANVIIIKFRNFALKTNCIKKRMNGRIFETNNIIKLDYRSKIPNFGLDMGSIGIFRNMKPSWIIHVFALLHAVVALTCRLAGVEDELLLTILTMAMALIICMKKNLSIEFTAAIIIIGNIIGYLMGTLGASILEAFIKTPYIVHALSTFVTTEVLGWSIVAIARIFRQNRQNAGSPTTPYLKWLLLAAGGIFVLRLCIVFLFNNSPADSTDVFTVVKKVLSNSFGLIILVCLNIMYIRYAGRAFKGRSRWLRTLTIILFMGMASFIETLITGFVLPLDLVPGFWQEFPLTFAVSLLTQVSIYCLIYMVNYSLTAKFQMQEERVKANMAQYQYLKLKRQVNPHFLFNSLNILDCLVCEEKTEQASTYIHKLAGIYRYLIRSEEETLVPLREELVFVNLYIDLLKVRVPEGFEVRINGPEAAEARFVLPCSLQLLIENAIKHNAVTAENPLRISIQSEGDNLKVSNNIVPKVTVSPSTGLGQKYIRQQYLDLSGKHIGIERTGESYCVTLPLL